MAPRLQTRNPPGGFPQDNDIVLHLAESGTNLLQFQIDWESSGIQSTGFYTVTRSILGACRTKYSLQTSYFRRKHSVPLMMSLKVNQGSLVILVPGHKG